MLSQEARAKHRQARSNGVWIAPVLLGAGLLRFVGLGRESIWLDEATSLLIARLGLPAVVAWAAGDIHPPLYYLALHFWLVLGESEFAIRALSASLGILAVAAGYALARELFGTRTGLLSAALLALSPLHIWYCQETRMYSMVTTLSLLASWTMVLALRRGKIRYWLAFVLLSAMALYTHYFALFVLLVQSLYALYWLWCHGGRFESRGTRDSKRAWRMWLCAQLAITVLFLPWVPILYRQVTTGGGGWVEKSIGRPPPSALLDTWIYYSTGLDRHVYPTLLRRLAYVLFAVCLLAAGHRLLFRRPSGEMLFPFLCVALPLGTVWLLSQVKPMYSIRYLLPFLPAYCILLVLGLDHLRPRAMGLGVLALLTLTLLVGDYNGWRKQQTPDWRGLASHILERAQPGDVVLFSPRWNQKPFDYYVRGRVPSNMDLPIPVTADAAQRVVTDIAAHHRRVWLVWEAGHYSDADGLAKAVLDRRFPIVEEEGFSGIGNVLVYDLSAQRSGS